LAFLSAVSIFSYDALQQSAHDVATMSSMDSVDGIVQNHALKNNLKDAYYYSGTPADVAALGYEPKDGSVVDVVTTSTDYCIRAYNTAGTKNSIYNAYTRESAPGICAEMPPSTTAATAYSGDNIWTDVSTAYHHTCAIDAFGKAYCWGLNDNGQLGDSTNNNSNSPVAVDVSGALAGKRIKSISTGYWSTCAIASDDLPYCWGQNTNGQLGDGTWDTSNVPVPVVTNGHLSGKTVSKIVSSWGRVCAIASDSLAYCWGNGDFGSLGWLDWGGGNSYTPEPLDMTGAMSGKTIKDIALGDHYGCALASDSRVYCWGENSGGEIGDNSVTQRNVPVATTTSGALVNKRITSLTTHNETTCVTASNGKAYCWGSAGEGAQGANSVSDVRVPTAVTASGVLSGVSLIRMAHGFDNSVCAYSKTMQFYCWGLDSYYQLGDNDTSNKLVPIVGTSINSINTMILDLGWQGDCAITTSYKLYCWGDGSSGRIGAGNNNSSNTPVLINPIL
jgi:alpha-tubulin suppressor-like RCC1 family protein